MNKKMQLLHFTNEKYAIPDELFYKSSEDKWLHRFDEIEVGSKIDFYNFFTVAPFTMVNDAL